MGLENNTGGQGMDWSLWRRGQMADSCECGNKPSAALKVREFSCLVEELFISFLRGIIFRRVSYPNSFSETIIPP
jgi:hypothetical protein